MIFSFAASYSIFYSFFNKGSLVDVVYVDYIKQEIRVNYFTLWNSPRKVVIPFEGMTWSILPGGLSLNRLRIFLKSGKRIVICDGGLGWSDIEQLKSALSKIVEEEHWFGTFFRRNS